MNYLSHPAIYSYNRELRNNDIYRMSAPLFLGKMQLNQVLCKNFGTLFLSPPQQICSTEQKGGGWEVTETMLCRSEHH